QGTQPGVAAQPPQPGQPGVANAPPPGAPLPGLPPGQRQPKGVPNSPATLQPGDEVVSEPPATKITNKKASFSGLDKITGRIINFDEDINETVQFGALRVKTSACYTRPSTEAANTDAFVEVDEITLQGEVKRIFSGWMYAARAAATSAAATAAGRIVRRVVWELADLCPGRCAARSDALQTRDPENPIVGP